MQVGSIDTQMLMPRTAEAGKVQSIRDQQQFIQQDNGAVIYQHEADHKLKQVQTTEKSEGEKIKDEEKKHGREHEEGHQRRENKQELETSEVKMAVDPARGTHIDIKM